MCNNAEGARATHEVNADGADVALCVGVIRKPEQQTRLAYAGVANEEELEQVITATGEDKSHTDCCRSHMNAFRPQSTSTTTAVMLMQDAPLQPACCRTSGEDTRGWTVEQSDAVQQQQRRVANDAGCIRFRCHPCTRGRTK